MWPPGNIGASKGIRGFARILKVWYGEAGRSFSAVHVHHSPPHQHHADHHTIEKNDEKEQITAKRENNYFNVCFHEKIEVILFCKLISFLSFVIINYARRNTRKPFQIQILHLNTFPVIPNIICLTNFHQILLI